MTQKRDSSLEYERSANAWRKVLKELPANHALQSWVWGDFKSRWGWSAQRLSLSIPDHETETVAAFQVLARRVPFLRR
ncbi:MAG: hypothetical protein R3293_19660, partial [Candidatus Promineifilaceae bacterium]|nr:hypothetical protein [Candidatus Promineifilaceae bacterium]